MSMPEIVGLGDIECSNLLREWFKWDGLAYLIKSRQVYELEQCLPEDDKPDLLTESQICLAISCIEEEIRSKLFDYGEALTKSSEQVSVYLDGVLDVVARLGVHRPVEDV